MTHRLNVHGEVSAPRDVDTLLIIGRREQLLSDHARASLPVGFAWAVWEDMVRSTEPGDSGRVASTFTGGRPSRLFVGVLPEPCSRHNSPSRAWAIPAMVRQANGAGSLGVIAMLGDRRHATATAAAVGRAAPQWSGNSRVRERDIHLALVAPDGVIESVAGVQRTVDAVRFAARLVDMPPDRLGPNALVDEALALAARFPDVEAEVTRGDDLLTAGLTGIHAVGRTSTQAPALVVLRYRPAQPKAHWAWVGKGITYDTGGLSIKAKTGMPGMKSDMGGAAAVLGAFQAAVSARLPAAITAVLCIAENAVGPASLRPDDVITMRSGRTVEVNNTDAEGRLVLADGIAWVVEAEQPDVIVDVATLTGAQGVATGRRHAAIVCNDEALERRAIEAGLATGDLCWALPYLPELLRVEFATPLADMRNSVKNRDNAQVSCAAQFIANHLGRHAGPWLHVDMAAPSTDAGRGTGFGVSLLLALLGESAPD